MDADPSDEGDGAPCRSERIGGIAKEFARMAQGTLDLTDTPTAVSAAAPSADDLLARMAGDEIDRLLAEADLQESAPAGGDNQVAGELPSVAEAEPVDGGAAPPDESTEIAVAVAADPAPVSKADEALTALPTESPAGEMTEPPEPDAPVGAQLQDLFAKLDEAESAPSAAEGSTGAGAASGPTGRWVRLALGPLEWINAPLAGYSDRVRAGLGWTALLTLANATGVLLYVLLVRR